jgi:hypothetical protein
MVTKANYITDHNYWMDKLYGCSESHMNWGESAAAAYLVADLCHDALALVTPDTTELEKVAVWKKFLADYESLALDSEVDRKVLAVALATFVKEMSKI